MQLHGFQLIVIWVSVVGSGLSAVFNIWACVRLTAWKFSFLPRIALIISATFALVYCASYIWLLYHPHAAADWSNTMRPFGMFAWLIGPWTALPAMSLIQGHRLSRRMVTDASNLIAEIRGSEEVGYLLNLDIETSDSS